MSDEGAFGDRLGSRFGMKNAPVVAVRTLRRSLLAVTEINFDILEFGRALPIPGNAHMTADTAADQLFWPNWCAR